MSASKSEISRDANNHNQIFTVKYAEARLNPDFDIVKFYKGCYRDNIEAGIKIDNGKKPNCFDDLIKLIMYSDRINFDYFKQHSQMSTLENELENIKKSSSEKTCNCLKKIGQMLSKLPSDLWVNLLFC